MNAPLDVPEWTALPAAVRAAFRVEHTPDFLLVVRTADEATLARAGYAPRPGDETRAQSEHTASALSGRAPLRELTAGSETFLLRRFTHGGVLRFLTGRRFRDPHRPVRELALAARLELAGIATPRVSAACARRASPFGWELELVTRRVEGSLDVGHVLRAARAGEVAPGRLALVSVAFGALVRRLHANGFVHADLTPNNVLVQRAALASADPELVVLDLDRSHFETGALDDATRRANLRRLYRFVERRELRDGRALRRTDYARFFLAYDLAGTQWKGDWRAIRTGHARAAPWHALGWLLERTFSRRVDPRDGVRGVAGRPRT